MHAVDFIRLPWTRAAALFTVVALAACGGSSDHAPPTYSVGGTVSGLSGSGLELRNNGGENLSISGDGTFAFTTPLTSGASYSVTVQTQPIDSSQTCVVANGSGQIGASNVTNVTVTCTTNSYTVGGFASGLPGSPIHLTNNDADPITISGDGAFVFPRAVASGSAYDVTIEAQPADPTQHCTVSNGFGTVGAANLTHVTVRCARSGRFAYITEFLVGVPGGGLPPGDVVAHTIDPSTGAFQPVAGSPFATDKCPCTLSASPDGRFAYVGSGGMLYPYSINDATGALGTPGTAASIGADAGGIGVDPRSRFLYVSDPVGNNLSGYSIDAADGSLTPMPGGSMPTGSSPGAARFDPAGKFLYVANAGSNGISAYTINGATGVLTAVVGSPFPASGNPDTVAVDASGQFLYATAGSSAPVASYMIDAATGALAPIAAYPLASNPVVPADAIFFLDPNSDRMYALGHCTYGSVCVMNATDPFTFDLWVFVIDDSSGRLVQSGMPQHLFETDEMSGLTSAQIDPSGKFVCARVTHGGGGTYDTLNCYGVDATTGAPSPGFHGNTGSLIDTGAYPVERWDAITIAR